MEFKFDHEKTRLSESIGWTIKEFEDYENKIEKLAKQIYKSKERKVSKIVEETLNQLSYSELVVTSSLYIQKILNDAKDKKSGVRVVKGLDGLEDLLNFLKKGE
jgi:predicted nuclease with TOPRIM domain